MLATCCFAVLASVTMNTHSASHDRRVFLLQIFYDVLVRLLSLCNEFIQMVDRLKVDFLMIRLDNQPPHHT